MTAPIKILLIEDDADDVELLEEAFRTNGVRYELNTLMQGDKILPWLLSCKALPDVIVMDLNMPRLHGTEIQKKISEEPELSKIPLVVLSTSSSENEKQYCMSLGARFFITKPTSVEGFKSAVEIIAKSAATGI